MHHQPVGLITKSKFPCTKCKDPNKGGLHNHGKTAKKYMKKYSEGK